MSMSESSARFRTFGSGIAARSMDHTAMGLMSRRPRIERTRTLAIKPHPFKINCLFNRIHVMSRGGIAHFDC